MDTYRRRSHRTHHEDRADALAALLAKALRAYGLTIELHGGCPSCAVDLEIFADQAAELGMDMRR